MHVPDESAPLAPGSSSALSHEQRLRELLAGSWDPLAYTKASDKRPRKKKPKPRQIPGGHTSVQRLLSGKVKVNAT